MIMNSLNFILGFTKYLDPYIPIVTALIALFVIAAFGKILLSLLKGSDGKLTFPYKQQNALFTPAERSFLGVLDSVLGDEFRVFGKVRIADVLQVTKQPNRSDWQKAFNRISAKHFDFVICRSSDLSVLLIIELDDKSHQKSAAKKADQFKNQATEAAGLPLLRLPCQREYSPEEIVQQLTPYL